MVASFFLSTTLVPVLSVWLLQHRKISEENEQRSWTGRLSALYGRVSLWTLRKPWPVLAVYGAVCALTLLLATTLGTELFPRVDTRQFQMRIRAAAGTRLERTEEIVREVDHALRELVGASSVKITLANIGNPAWTYPVNGVFVWNSGPQEALLLVALQGSNRRSVAEIEDDLRKVLSKRFPDVHFSFEAGDIISQVLNFGAPTPINVTISGNKLAETRQYAERLVASLKEIPALQDVQVPQALDYPTLRIAVDRERAGQLGVSVDRVGRSIVGATSSSVLVTPNFWTNPETGVPYRVALRVPENQVASLEDVRNIPVMADGSPRPLVRDIADVEPGKTFGEIDHYNSQRALNVIANVRGNDFGRAQSVVERAISRLGAPPRGTTVAIHGQVEQMRSALDGLRDGLFLSVLVVLLLLVASFQSVRDSLIVLSTVPAVLGGVALALKLTGSTLNVQSLMGAIMAIGVSVANALLLVTFARDRRQQGDSPEDAAWTAAKGRLRPILMTSIAMVAGMVPIALGFGEGGEQTAPLGRAVIGGLLASTAATLLILPAVYARAARKGAWRSTSLAPEQPIGAVHP
jgi:multidrug efflux pump subunit AcrB